MKKAKLCLGLGIFAAFLLVVACQKDNKSNSGTPSVKTPKNWTSDEISQFVIKKIKADNTPFDWAKASDDMLFSALQNSDKMLAIGFKKANASDSETEQFNAANNPDWQAAKDELVKIIIESEQKANPSVDYTKFTIGSDFDNLNAFYVKIYGFETLQKLRQSPLVRYVYPSGFEPTSDDVTTRSSNGGSGCDGYAGENLTINTDYTQISPNAKQSWSYGQPQIPQAWASTTGAGIGVMVIDAGVSSAQAMYQQANFASGASSASRTVTLLSRLPSSVNFWGTQILAYEPSPYSTCGHGTAMTGIIASPRNNFGSSVGVAYNCNLISVRAVEDVVISNSKEELGVAAALNLAVSRSDVKIVSMSNGSITTRSVIGDAIKAVKNSGKLAFCAQVFCAWAAVVLIRTVIKQRKGVMLFIVVVIFLSKKKRISIALKRDPLSIRSTFRTFVKILLSKT